MAERGNLAGPGVTSSPVRARKRRLFFALWPDEVTRARLAAFLAALPKGEGKDMRAENLHLTLAFLGDCEEGLLPCLEAVGAALAGAPFILRLDRLGHFARARVLWLGPSEVPSALLELQSHLLDLLVRHCGWAGEARPFVPHVTLRRDARHACPWPGDMPPVPWDVRDVALVESNPGPEGVVYRPIRTWPLSAALPAG